MLNKRSGEINLKRKTSHGFILWAPVLLFSSSDNCINKVVWPSNIRPIYSANLKKKNNNNNKREREKGFILRIVSREQPTLGSLGLCDPENEMQKLDKEKTELKEAISEQNNSLNLLIWYAFSRATFCFLFQAVIFLIST